MYVILRKIKQPKLRKWQKKKFSGPILVHLTRIRTANFFFKHPAPSVTRCHGQLSSCSISEKTNDSTLRKLSDGQMDGQADESDFIGRCATNVERPIYNKTFSAGS